MKKSVIIHGKKVTEHSPRKGREHCELWGVTRSNQRYWDGELTDWTRWFDLHWIQPRKSPTGHPWPGLKKRRPQTWDWYKAQDASRPIYLQEVVKEIPASVRFPIEDVLAKFPGDLGVWTCQVDLMMAFALMEGFEQIILNGIGVGDRASYQVLHKGIAQWITYARATGVEVIVEAPSVYATNPLVYGYDFIGYDVRIRP
jgi:hypothetical protein